MDHTKVDTAYLDFSRRELSDGGLGIVVALAVFFRNLFFVCLYWGSNPAVSYCYYYTKPRARHRRGGSGGGGDAVVGATEYAGEDGGYSTA